MKSKKHGIILVLVMFVIITALILNFVAIRTMSSPQNQFGISSGDSFSMSHAYNVNGAVGYTKTSFRAGERKEIIDFTNELRFKKTQDIQGETIYGIPPCLKVFSRSRTILFELYSKDNIVVLKEDKNGMIISRAQYGANAVQLKKMYIILGLTDKETW